MAEKSIASFKRTETWPWCPCGPSGPGVSNSSSGIHARPRRAADSTLCLDPQLVESVLILTTERVLFDFLLEARHVPDFQERQIPQHRHVTLNLCRVAQQRRNQQPSLSVHLHHLPVVVRAVQKLLLGGIEG